jgi:hypothetical protein
MIGLFFSEAILFAVAALIGFGVGWRLRASFVAKRNAEDKHDVQHLRGVLSDAQVRKARGL